jgi:hypothetical protein
MKRNSDISLKGAKHVLSPSATLRINSVEGAPKFGEMRERKKL